MVPEAMPWCVCGTADMIAELLGAAKMPMPRPVHIRPPINKINVAGLIIIPIMINMVRLITLRHIPVVENIRVPKWSDKVPTIGETMVIIIEGIVKKSPICKGELFRILFK